MERVRSFRRTVPTIGKPVPLVDQSMPVAHVTIFAMSTNTGRIYLGDNGVQAVAGLESGFQMFTNDSQTFHDVDLKDIWIDATVVDEGVTIGVVVRGL